MENLFKRYVFKNDLFNDSELESLAISKFAETQHRVGSLKEPSFRSKLVIQRARTLCREILGDYDLEEHYHSCRFGKRASVGVPKRDSYLDSRLAAPLSGSHAHIKWFKSYLTSDSKLEAVICECQKSDVPNYAVCDTLTLTNVPKSYKSLRSIMPNTTIGGFYSYGLGRMLQRRLTNVGLDIRRLQMRHRRLVKLFSRTRTHVTADLSAASDSFNWSLLCRIIPRQWFNHLNLGRIRKYKVKSSKETYPLSSFMTMGIGFTFQLQTLVFYCLLKSLQELTGLKGLISVYGDDLIYPTALHLYVRQVFPDLGLLINEDKTFVKESFRESCGADSYCGIDVRPFQPEGCASMLSSREYELFLYKTINGLQKRWDKVEIPQTLRFLQSELISCTDTILQVPPSYPDYSGVHVDQPMKDFLTPWAEVTADNNLSFCFSYLRLCTRNRIVVHHAPFYWDKLRDPAPEKDHYGEEVDVNYIYARFKRELFRWVKSKYPPKNYRSKVTGRRLVKLEATIASKDGSISIIRQTGTTNTWN